jgi:hypothetical protein
MYLGIYIYEDEGMSVNLIEAPDEVGAKEKYLNAYPERDLSSVYIIPMSQVDIIE